MYLIREVLTCQPGKVRPMIEKFKGISALLKEMGHPPFRIMTDVSGEAFWTIVAETEVANLDEFFGTQQKVMSSDAFRKAMSGYHDLVQSGRREVFRVEA